MGPLSSLSKQALEQRLSGAFDNSSLLQSIPLSRWAVYKACKLPLKDSYPSLIESLSYLGLYISAIGLSISLVNYYIAPAICCGAIMMIFRYSILELRKQVAMNAQIQRLETVNTSLEKIVSRQEKQVEELQTTLQEAKITTEHIQELKKQEQQSLETCQKLEKELAETTQKLQGVQAGLEAVHEKLKQEVDRLAQVPSG